MCYINLNAFYFQKWSETGRELSLLSFSKIVDTICLFTATIHAVCLFAALSLLSFDKCYWLSWDFNTCFLPFFSLTSTISLFIVLAQDMLFYVAVILSLWHILFPFAGLANNYEALFSRKQTVFVSLRNQYMLSVFSFICNDTCCLFFCCFSLCYMRFGLIGPVA